MLVQSFRKTRLIKKKKKVKCDVQVINKAGKQHLLIEGGGKKTKQNVYP